MNRGEMGNWSFGFGFGHGIYAILFWVAVILVVAAAVKYIISKK